DGIRDFHVTGVQTCALPICPHGPTCHTGSTSCFGDAPGQFLGALDALVEQRERERPLDSYTTQLFEKGTRRIAQKVGEEGVEAEIGRASCRERVERGEVGER